MPQMQNIKQKSTKLVLFALLIVFTVFSLVFMTIEAGHDCSGEDCPICSLILTLQQNLRLFGLFAAGTAVFGICIFNDEKTSRAKASYFIQPLSLVSHKIKMNE